MRAHRVGLQKYLLAVTLFILGIGVGAACVSAGQETPAAGANPPQSAAPARVVKKAAAAKPGSM